MPSGRCRRLDQLPPAARSVVDGAMRAVLATIDDAGCPHLVPITWALVGDEIVSAIDHKPKSTQSLARLRHLDARPQASVLFDRYDDDWERLGWVMARGKGRIAEPGTGRAELSARYRPYVEQPPQGAVIVVAPETVTWWLASSGE